MVMAVTMSPQAVIVLLLFPRNQGCASLNGWQTLQEWVLGDLRTADSEGELAFVLRQITQFKILIQMVIHIIISQFRVQGMLSILHYIIGITAGMSVVVGPLLPWHLRSSNHLEDGHVCPWGQITHHTPCERAIMCLNELGIALCSLHQPHTNLLPAHHSVITGRNNDETDRERK